jgi:hypothetical protein
LAERHEDRTNLNGPTKELLDNRQAARNLISRKIPASLADGQPVGHFKSPQHGYQGSLAMEQRLPQM